MLIIRLFYSSHCRGVKWYLIVVLMCISQMTNDVEHLFVVLLAREKMCLGRFPGGPVVRTQHFHCHGPAFNP